MVVAHIGANGHPLRLTGGGEHEERAADLDSSQRVRVHLVAYHLAPATRKKPIFTNLKKNIRTHRASSKGTILLLTK